ncbi:MAG: preprotein translocase subunit SecY [Elusimicrobia bacterium RIFOXYC2_FULL_34_12]|nr:MAG: preprotein translocase subunit SecY [Elusimicrobia bacterium RIFOXYC2_FULL_34_12]
MIESFGDIFKVPELKKRIFFTVIVMIAYRIGVAVPVPGIDIAAFKAFFAAQSNTLFGFMDMFSGGALSRLSIFTLGIMPYINASIIFSLLQATIPYLEKLSKEGETGRKKITQWTRYATLLLAAIQAIGLTLFMIVPMKAPDGSSVVANPGFTFVFTTVLTMVTGTMFIMWMGEQLTENGIGNGISLIIFAGIVDRLPSAVKNLFILIKTHEMSLFTGILIIAMVFLITAIVVWVETGQRKIPVQYAKRIVGRKMYGGQATFLPIKVDQSGVIAVIFAVSLMSVPMTLAQFSGKSEFIQKFVEWWMRGNILYEVMYAALIIFFCYFYNAITLNPKDIAENMKKWGGFIPGIRPGEPTESYIKWILARITLGGALFVTFIAILPDYLRRFVNVPFFFGGTALLIVVGVALDTISQVESHLIMRHYDGFLKKGRIKGRWFNVK